MTLFEHQSTYNPNMPLRGFLYFASLYHSFIADYPDLNMYGSKLIKIPPLNILFFIMALTRRLKAKEQN